MSLNCDIDLWDLHVVGGVVDNVPIPELVLVNHNSTGLKADLKQQKG